MNHQVEWSPWNLFRTQFLTRRCVNFKAICWNNLEFFCKAQFGPACADGPYPKKSVTPRFGVVRSADRGKAQWFAKICLNLLKYPSWLISPGSTCFFCFDGRKRGKSDKDIGACPIDGLELGPQAWHEDITGATFKDTEDKSLQLQPRINTTLVYQ